MSKILSNEEDIKYMNISYVGLDYVFLAGVEFGAGLRVSEETVVTKWTHKPLSNFYNF